MMIMMVLLMGLILVPKELCHGLEIQPAIWMMMAVMMLQRTSMTITIVFSMWMTIAR